MSKKTKKSFADKMQKSPFMMVGVIAAAVAALIVVLSVTSGIKKGIAEKNAETTAPFKSAETAVTEAKLFNSKQAESKDVKLYDKSVRTASYAATSSFFRLSLSFSGGVPEINSAFIAVFIDEKTVVKLPCTVETDKISADFLLEDISDIKNLLSVTDGINLTFESFPAAKPFALYINTASSPDKALALCGTFKGTPSSASVENKALFHDAESRIKRVETVMNDGFLWLDIYFADENSFNTLNYGFKNNFIGFKYGDKSTLFSVTEYKDLKMLRCKFDSYALAQFRKDTGKSDITIPEIFKDVEIFSSNYDDKTELFILE